jgi:hypothetical protein
MATKTKTSKKTSKKTYASNSKLRFAGAEGWKPIDARTTEKANKEVGDVLNGMIRMGFTSPTGGVILGCFAFKDEKEADIYMAVIGERIHAQSCVRARLAVIQCVDLLPGERTFALMVGKTASDEAWEQMKGVLMGE